MHATIGPNAHAKASHPRTVLVIDDENDITSSVRDLLENTLENCLVVTASSCLEGLQTLGMVHVDAALVDYRMPQHTGLDFIERARRLEPALPIVLMSACNSMDLAAKAVNHHHVQGLLAKPLDPFELAETVASSLRTREPQPGRIPPEPRPRDTL